MSPVPSYRAWPGPVRLLATAIDDAVAAAEGDDEAGFADALGRLARADREPLAVVLGELAAALLERTFPDGIDTADAGDLLARCTARFSWCPALAEDALVQALAGTLGISLLEDEPLLPATVPNGLLLVTELSAGRPLAPVLDVALRELQRRQTVELP
jgi:hypothetical protein